MKIALFQVWVPSRRSSGISASEANSVHAGAPVRGASDTGGPKLDEDIHIILRGPKWDDLQQRFRIKRPLVLHFVRSMASNYLVMCLQHQR